jgi:hypothetical protein
VVFFLLISLMFIGHDCAVAPVVVLVAGLDAGCMDLCFIYKAGRKPISRGWELWCLINVIYSRREATFPLIPRRPW